MKKFLAITAVILGLSLLTSCSGRNELTDVESYEYNPSGSETSEGDETTLSASADNNVTFTVDNSWQKNFRVVYRYYNNENETSSVTVRETKTSEAFAVEYLNSDSAILYYKASGANTDLYTIIPTNTEQTHTLLTGKPFSSLSSLFMKLSAVEEDLSSQSNVMYMNDETVSGRNCHKYIQRAYTDGEVTQTVYVWIDAEFGFAAKCQALDGTGMLTLSWEITTFETGDIKESSIGINISDYNFKEISE